MNKIDNKDYKLFLRYLKENNIYKEYFKEVNKFGFISVKSYQSLIETMTIYQVQDFDELINKTIYWKNTEKGYDFWKFHHEKLIRLFAIKEYIS